jgi:hypothetical protein
MLGTMDLGLGVAVADKPYKRLPPSRRPGPALPGVDVIAASAHLAPRQFRAAGSLTWTATGNPDHEKQNVRNQTPAGSTHFRFTGTSRESTVTGSVNLNGVTYPLTTDTVLSTTFGGNSTSFLRLERR